MKNNKSAYNKAVERMEQEVNRAVARVKKLEQLYTTSQKRTQVVGR